MTTVAAFCRDNFYINQERNNFLLAQRKAADLDENDTSRDYEFMASFIAYERRSQLPNNYVLTRQDYIISIVAKIALMVFKFIITFGDMLYRSPPNVSNFSQDVKKGARVSLFNAPIILPIMILTPSPESPPLIKGIVDNLTLLTPYTPEARMNKIFGEAKSILMQNIMDRVVLFLLKKCIKNLPTAENSTQQLTMVVLGDLQVRVAHLIKKPLLSLFR